LREVIIDAFHEGYCGLPLTYVVEESPLGTGGAIREALRHVNGSSALVMNGDTYVKLDFAAMFSRHLRGESPITMAVTKVDDTARYGGVVVKDQRVVGFVEKGKKGPGWINAGVYVLSRNFPWPQLFASRFSFENDVLTPFLTDLRPTAFPHTGYFLDIGVPEDLDRAQIELA
jgi:D-glycero-alpha-D-manno-heptose 1-phosphate guanylyltransferase